VSLTLTLTLTLPVPHVDLGAGLLQYADNSCDDPNTKQFVDLLSHYGFVCQPTTTTHSAGGTIDAVITRCDANDTDRCVVGPLSVSVVDVGLSDHHLLTWSLPARRPPLQSQTVRCRPWRNLDVSQLCDELS